MSISHISTLGFHGPVRRESQRVSSDLQAAQLELASGRHADEGLSLGVRIGEALDLRGARGAIDTLTTTNDYNLASLGLSQTALARSQDALQDFVADLVAVRPGGVDRSVAVGTSESALATLSAALTVTFDGSYLFSGLATDKPPFVDDLIDPAGSLRASVDAAFLAEFGIATTSPLVSAIAPADMANFLEGGFADLFTEPNWSSLISNASDDARLARIGLNETVVTSVSANDEAIKDFVASTLAVQALGAEGLSSDTFRLTVDHAIGLANSSLSGLTRMQAQLGISQDRVSRAQEVLRVQRDLMEVQSANLEGVDAYEAATRVTTLTVQLEASYSVTGRLQRLSLLNYLS